MWRLPAPVDDVIRSDQAFRYFLDIGCACADVGEMGDAAGACIDDGEGAAHDGEELGIILSVDGMDSAVVDIFFVVEIWNDEVEASAYFLTGGFYTIGWGNEYEIVAADMADIGIGVFEIANGVDEDPGGHSEDFVASAEAVFIIEGFEVIEIQVSEGEMLAFFEALFGFPHDSEISRKPGERIGVYIP